MAATWLAHQRRDDYWKQGSVCEDYVAITAAVYAVGGWADGYSNAIPRLLAGLPGPKKGLIGPWAHAYPHAAQPGPQIGFLQEALRWWDHWLKGIDTGIMDEPVLRAWMQESVRPATTYAERPGPLDRRDRRGRRRDRQTEAAASVRAARLAETPGSEATACSSPPAWRPASPSASGAPTAWPANCRPTSGRTTGAPSASTREPLSQRVEIFGAPVVTLDLACRQACRDDRGAARGRRAGRHLDARHLRAAQPDASRRPRTSAGAGAGADISRARSRSTTSRRRFRRATASGWRSPPRTGRSPGRRPNWRRCSLSADGSNLVAAGPRAVLLPTQSLSPFPPPKRPRASRT